MSNHLSEDQFAQCVAGQPPGAELQHLAQCSECRAELERFSNTLSLFRSAMRDQIDDRAAASILVAAPFSIRPAEAGASNWQWSCIGAAIVIAAVLPFLVPAKQPQQFAEPVSIESTPDELMEAVNLQLSRTIPTPMEPLLALIPGEELMNKSRGVQ
jgi:hypothetical protein